MTAGWAFGPDLPPGSADLILADPPWKFKRYSDAGDTRSPDRHYRCMSLRDIMSLPVDHLAGRNAALVMWYTWPFLPHALETCRVWGFTYKTGGSWHKRTRAGDTALGTGLILRGGSEPYMIATRGKPIRGSKAGVGAFETEIDTIRREHSRKPEEMADMVGRLYPYARKVELFARERRPGWLSWGDEIGKFERG